ncbi:hypothetical protein CYMTET_46363 [Cymbomonas tetramitiformis]|uniref:Uncharacterized protein n=1 Tax=Cymbomonas tetramitiformis TaxID=36881 RepID=A0AAE0BY82_9CHLO|nr:hypothetical protein CYMTET_46363 [Cymbomonas tetramitiformis]
MEHGGMAGWGVNKEARYFDSAEYQHFGYRLEDRPSDPNKQVQEWFSYLDSPQFANLAKSTFEKSDINKDSKITVNELSGAANSILRAVKKQHQGKVPKPKLSVNKMMDAFDINRDGRFIVSKFFILVFPPLPARSFFSYKHELAMLEVLQHSPVSRSRCTLGCCNPQQDLSRGALTALIVFAAYGFSDAPARALVIDFFARDSGGHAWIVPWTALTSKSSCIS